MKLRKQLIAALAATALAVPATAVSVFTLSATPAFAKSDKSQGKGKGSDRGRSSRSSAKEKKPNKSNAGGFGNGAAKGKKATYASAPAGDVAATDMEEPVTLRPDQLGSMNGAMHANINAVLAHIRNGNTKNGPVGALAGLAVADYNAEGAQETIDETTAAYPGLEEDLEDAIANSEQYGSLEEYLAASEKEGFVEDEGIEDALAALNDADQKIDDAEAALEAQAAAEGGILDAWNKSGEATDEEQDALLQALRDRLEAESTAISDTIGQLDMANADDEVTDDDMDGDEPTDEDVVVE